MRTCLVVVGEREPPLVPQVPHEQHRAQDEPRQGEARFSLGDFLVGQPGQEERRSLGRGTGAGRCPGSQSQARGCVKALRGSQWR